MRSPFCSVLLLALAVLPAWGQSSVVPHVRAERIARRLGLSEDQTARIRAIRDQNRPDLDLKREAVRTTTLALRTGLGDPSLPEPQVRTLFEAATTARLDLLLARRSVHLAVQAVLTPEQRAQALAWSQRAQAERVERRRHLRLAAGLRD